MKTGSYWVIKMCDTVTLFLLIFAKLGASAEISNVERKLSLFFLYGDDMQNISSKIDALNLSNQRFEQEFSSQQEAFKKDLKTLQHKLEENLEAIQRDIATIMDSIINLNDSRKRPTTCAEAILKSEGKSGVHLLHLPDATAEPFYAYCLDDPKKGAAWTIIQRRENNNTDFYLGWNEYKKGFGDITGNYFLGLDNLHAITYTSEHELWISMEDFEGEKRSAYYDSFAIGDEEEKYALKVLGKYTGNAGNSLSPHKGMKFSSKDADHDRSINSCAELKEGAWWYDECYYSNLNARYLKGVETADQRGRGIQWRHFHEGYSLKYVHMAIRPKYV